MIRQSSVFCSLEFFSFFLFIDLLSIVAVSGTYPTHQQPDTKERGMDAPQHVTVVNAEKRRDEGKLQGGAHWAPPAAWVEKPAASEASSATGTGPLEQSSLGQSSLEQSSLEQWTGGRPLNPVRSTYDVGLAAANRSWKIISAEACTAKTVGKIIFLGLPRRLRL